MKLTYNVTGADRKLLVKSISEITGTPSKYLGAPTFAYSVGEYHIDKSGTVTGDDNRELVADLCEKHEFKATTEEYSEFPAVVETDSEYDKLTIEIPIGDLTSDKLDNIYKMVDAKAPLIKVALAVNNIPILKTDETLKFPWFWNENALTSDEVAAFSTLIHKICETAKTKKRIVAKERGIDDNPKYAFRCWLLSLGFIGDEYKIARKILLSRLGGNSAWKNGKNENVAESS